MLWKPFKKYKNEYINKNNDKDLEELKEHYLKIRKELLIQIHKQTKKQNYKKVKKALKMLEELDDIISKKI